MTNISEKDEDYKDQQLSPRYGYIILPHSICMDEIVVI
jgi:hypothetical protein